jgi:hypothetical protein
MDNLARNAMLAKEAGLSYGKWKALQPVVEPKRKLLPEGWKECPWCGKDFKGRSNKRYCDIECRLQDYNRRRRITDKEYMIQGRKAGR